jgi:hypothetical protein
VVEDGAGLAEADTVRGTASMLMQWHAIAPSERVAMKARAVACYQRCFRMEAAASRLVATIAPHLRPT